MFEVADLAHVWVQAQVYEDQIGLVREGQAVEATVEAFPGEIFPGKVAFIQPHLDPATRTVEVRFDLDEPRPRLRPGHVRHGDAEDPGGRDPDVPRAGSPLARPRATGWRARPRPSRRSAR